MARAHFALVLNHEITGKQFNELKGSLTPIKFINSQREHFFQKYPGPGTYEPLNGYRRCTSPDHGLFFLMKEDLVQSGSIIPHDVKYMADVVIDDDALLYVCHSDNYTWFKANRLTLTNECEVAINQMLSAKEIEQAVRLQPCFLKKMFHCFEDNDIRTHMLHLVAGNGILNHIPLHVDYAILDDYLFFSGSYLIRMVNTDRVIPKETYLRALCAWKPCSWEFIASKIIDAQFLVDTMHYACVFYKRIGDDIYLALSWHLFMLELTTLYNLFIVHAIHVLYAYFPTELDKIVMSKFLSGAVKRYKALAPTELFPPVKTFTGPREWHDYITNKYPGFYDGAKKSVRRMHDAGQELDENMVKHLQALDPSFVLVDKSSEVTNETPQMRHGYNLRKRKRV
jgi:hypothetical protein